MSNMPTNYKTVLYDNFGGSTLNSKNWPQIYGGRSSNGAYSYNKSDIKTGNGLTINTTKSGGSWTTGGFGQGTSGGEYGLYQVDAKVSPGQGTGPEVNLWPDNNQYPGPEIDLLEAPNGKGNAYMTLHWKASNGSGQYTTINTGVNVNSYHDYAVDWEPNSLTFYVDGKQVWTTTQNIPHQTMGLDFAGFVAASNDSWYGGGPNASTPSTVPFNVAWASISKPSGAASVSAAATPQASANSAVSVVTSASVGNIDTSSAQFLSTQQGTDILQGGSGNDTFYVNAASPDGWAEINNWHAGDFVDFIGAQQGVSTITWANSTDPNGHYGATASISLHGDGHIDSTVTFVGVDAAKLQGANLSAWTHDGVANLGIHG